MAIYAQPLGDLRRTLEDLAAFLATRGVSAWLVGGAARDLARGAAPSDLDLAVAGDGYALAREYADARGAAFVPLDEGRATGRVVVPGTRPLTLDLAALRGPTIEADLRLRDFTLNALALPLTGDSSTGGPARPSALSLQPSAFLDPTGGLADLRAGLLRACGPTSLRDDPLRVLRAARLCATLGARPEPGLAALMREAAPGLDAVAPERARDELLKLLDAPVSAPWLRYLDDCRALTRLIPELEPARACDQPRVHFLPVLAHILETVAALDWLFVGEPGSPTPPLLAEPREPAPPPALAGEPASPTPPLLAEPREPTPPLLAEPREPAPPPALAGEPASPPLLAEPREPGEDLPVAVQTCPDLSRALPYPERLGALLAERRAGGHRRAALLKLAALLHDVAKPQTKQVHPDGKVSFYDHQTIGAEVAARVARRLRLSRQDGAYVALVVREHMRPGQLRASDVVTLRAVVRLFRDLGDAGPDVLLHELADHLATRGPHIDPRGWAAHLAWVEALLGVYYEPAPARRRPLVDGNALMAALGIGPGPRVGALLREIGEAQAAGEVTTVEEALELARRMLGEG